ncbi:methyltransferase domain-containing protein [Pantoea sp. B65]|uniref:methyltransferase domain-containing protein n=1 Tax=Pantoea sp. B65 TaxID=2813359 RepID=UPI0039B45150
MSQTLSQRVTALPEVYQAIYRHPEWDRQAARDCQPRLEVISDVCQRLSAELKRPLRILDLGCAQGFFSLSLASQGATVTGIDFQAENIALCRALAQENPELSVTFIQGRIEEMIAEPPPGQYDLVLGLSVFHHIVHLHGWPQVQQWLARLMDAVQVAIFELAQQQEPLYWGPSQPDDPRSLIEHCAFYHQIAAFDTHLSPVHRPMFVASNYWLLLGDICWRFDEWRNYPYRGVYREMHYGSRRYYFSDRFVGKLIDFTSPDNRIPAEILDRNKAELCQEVNILQHPPAGLYVPQLFAHGKDQHQGWLLMSRLEGELLSELQMTHTEFSVDKVLADILQQTAALEHAGLYHDDIRVWNVMYNNQQQNFMLIDYGSISEVPQDCVWPHNIFQAFFIFVNELLIPGLVHPGAARPVLLSPFHLSPPYASWLYAFWQTPVAGWSFRLLADLFACRASLPAPDVSQNGLEAWLKAQELHLLQQAQQNTDQSRQLAALVQQEQPTDADRLALLEQQCRQLENGYQRYEQTLQDLSVHLAVVGKEDLPTREGGKYYYLYLQKKKELNEFKRKFRQQHSQEIKLLQTIEEMEHDAWLARHEVALIYQSQFWKITSPLRFTFRYTKKFYLFCKHFDREKSPKILFIFILNKLDKTPDLKHRLKSIAKKIGLGNTIRNIIYKNTDPKNNIVPNNISESARMIYSRIKIYKFNEDKD